MSTIVHMYHIKVWQQTLTFPLPGEPGTKTRLHYCHMLYTFEQGPKPTCYMVQHVLNVVTRVWKVIRTHVPAWEQVKHSWNEARCPGNETGVLGMSPGVMGMRLTCLTWTSAAGWESQKNKTVYLYLQIVFLLCHCYHTMSHLELKYILWYNKKQLLMRIELSALRLKVTGTCSWIKLLCHRLACITFPTKKLPDFLQQPVATEGIWLYMNIISMSQTRL